MKQQRKGKQASHSEDACDDGCPLAKVAAFKPCKGQKNMSDCGSQPRQEQELPPTSKGGGEYSAKKHQQHAERRQGIASQDHE
jgi:hypothetical protein